MYTIEQQFCCHSCPWFHHIFLSSLYVHILMCSIPVYIFHTTTYVCTVLASWPLPQLFFQCPFKYVPAARGHGHYSKWDIYVWEDGRPLAAVRTPLSGEGPCHMSHNPMTDFWMVVTHGDPILKHILIWVPLTNRKFQQFLYWISGIHIRMFLSVLNIPEINHFLPRAFHASNCPAPAHIGYPDTFITSPQISYSLLQYLSFHNIFKFHWNRPSSWAWSAI